MQQAQHATRRQETGNSLYLNEPPLYQLLVSGKKAVIDLREDHLSRCVRSRGRRSEGRRLAQDRVPKRREEEEGRKEEDAERNLLGRSVFQKQNGVSRRGEGSTLPVNGGAGIPPPVRSALAFIGARRSVGPGGRTHQPSAKRLGHKGAASGRHETRRCGRSTKWL